MENEHVNLLMQDLCGRLSYNSLKVEYKGGAYDVLGIAHGRMAIALPFSSCCEHPLVSDGEVLPYLFPLSAMTDEQRKEFFNEAQYDIQECDCGRHTEKYIYDMVGHEDALYPNYDAIDWLNKNNFDYRGLIGLGLAIDASKNNVYDNSLA